MASPDRLSDLREIWVFGPDDYREVVGECGTVHADRAGAVASALRMWLRLDRWTPDALPDELLMYPSWLRSCGVDPRACRVQARAVEAELNGVAEHEPALA